VVEYLPSKLWALSSNPSAEKRKKETERERERETERERDRERKEGRKKEIINGDRSLIHPSVSTY
jgi:hypothetical protein